MSWDLSSEEAIVEKLEKQFTTINNFAQKIKQLEKENKSLLAMIKLWEERNKENIQKIEVFEQREWEKLANLDEQIKQLEKENSELKARMSFSLIVLYDMAYHLECRDFYIKDWSDFIKIEELLKWEREE